MLDEIEFRPEQAKPTSHRTKSVLHPDNSELALHEATRRLPRAAESIDLAELKSHRAILAHRVYCQDGTTKYLVTYDMMDTNHLYRIILGKSPNVWDLYNPDFVESIEVACSENRDLLLLFIKILHDLLARSFQLIDDLPAKMGDIQITVGMENIKTPSDIDRIIADIRKIILGEMIVDRRAAQERILRMFNQ